MCLVYSLYIPGLVLVSRTQPGLGLKNSPDLFRHRKEFLQVPIDLGEVLPTSEPETRPLGSALDRSSFTSRRESLNFLLLNLILSAAILRPFSNLPDNGTQAESTLFCSSSCWLGNTFCSRQTSPDDRPQMCLNFHSRVSLCLIRLFQVTRATGMFYK